MTESSFPFDQPAEPLGMDQGHEDGGRDGRLVLVGAVAAVALAGAGFVLLGGGGDVEEELAAAPVRPRAAATAAAPAPLEIVPVAATDVVGRNPFKARYVAPAVAPASTTGTPGPATVQAPALNGGFTMSPDGSGGVVVRPQTPTATTTTPPSAGSTGGVAAPASSEVGLVRGEQKDGVLVAVFTVDGQPTTVKVGETFGSRKQVLLVSVHEGPGAGQWTAVLRVGDAPPKDVVSGEKIHVTA
jgi:hypothetical protein